MGYNPQRIMNIYEMIRRWHQGHTISGIATALSLDRKTVRKYVQAGIDRRAPCKRGRSTQNVADAGRSQ